MTDTTNFSAYGTSFQEKTVQALLLDPKWAEQVIEVLKPEYFDLKYLQFLTDRYYKYSQKYRVFPTMPMLLTIIKDDLKKNSDTLLVDQVISYLQRIKNTPDLTDLPYVKEKSLDFCRKQALKDAMVIAIDDLEEGKYEQIAEGIKKATMIGTTPSLGHNFFVDYEARFTKLNRNAVATGFPALDAKDILDGGLGAGEYGVITASTGVGKSHFLIALACNALRNSVNVLHYTFELSETQTARRYDSNLCDIDSNELFDKKDEVLKKYKDTNLGSLYVKYYPPNTATIYTIRSHIERCTMNGFVPGLIVLDYADLMRSTRQFDSLRHELKLVYEELRGFAGELGVPIWSASQSNKEGANSDVVDLTNMSESYGKAMTCDVVLSLSRRSHEKANGNGRLYIAKNRAGKDGLVYPLKMNTARSQFELVGDCVIPEQDVSSEENLRLRIKEKMNSLKGDLKLKDVND